MLSNGTNKSIANFRETTPLREILVFYRYGKRSSFRDSLGLNLCYFAFDASIVSINKLKQKFPELRN
jgi:hypothetical protein